MGTGQISRADGIVLAARQLEGPTQSAFLEQACGSDLVLRTKVDALMLRPDAPSIHDGETAGAAPPAATDPNATLVDKRTGSPEVGSTIGVYKLLQEIGEGGFGMVYMAEQSRPVVRKVALKIIKLGMDTKQVIGRFEAERQALAMMDHPNIAKVLDAGATENGRPYFVMELVRGIPITEYCDQNNLTTRERVELMIMTCHAVQHAHHKGIIHRDIKPSNVLVTLHDTQPTPKVIDFGIAKATNQKLTDKTVFTEFHQLIGTPEYMSPEQAEMSGMDIDTRTDIYSLGVLMYELFTGTTPFEKLRKAAGAEMQRIIREEHPTRPSTRVSALGDALAPTARHRSTDPAALGRGLRGDLDWIVMKTLEKDRNRRYETANGLASDLKRYLEDEAVLAGPPTAAYRLCKLVNRHRAAISTASAVVAALIIAFSALIWGFVQVSAERDLTAERKVTSQAELLLHTMNSVRNYTSENVRPYLLPLLDDSETFIREVVPGFSAREVFENFRANPEYEQFLYKEATLNPSNPRDQADEFEAGLVRQFKQDAEETEITGIRNGAGGKLFYVARPIRITKESCLECHGPAAEAPESMIAMYGSTKGYGWNMNEIVGTQMVYVPASHLVDREDRPFPLPILIVTVLTLSAFGAFLIMIFRRPFKSKRGAAYH